MPNQTTENKPTTEARRLHEWVDGQGYWRSVTPGTNPAGDLLHGMIEAALAAEREQERAEIRREIEGLDERTATLTGVPRGPILMAGHNAYRFVLAMLDAREPVL